MVEISFSLHSPKLQLLNLIQELINRGESDIHTENNYLILFFNRTIAYDYEALQFVADFKTTPHDPTAIYFVSSKFHRFFLKNVSPYELNTRILRIGNVVQSSPHNFAPSFQTIPQFSQNSLVPSPQSPFPTSGYPSPPPNAYSVQPNYSYYNFVNQYPTSRIAPQPTYAPTPAVYPTTSYNHQPVTSFYKFRGSSPYAYERFGLAERHQNFPSYHTTHLNAGETIPQQPSAYANFNYGFTSGDVYRSTRNATLQH